MFLFLFLVGSGVYSLEINPYFSSDRIVGYLFMPLDMPSIIRKDIFYFSTRYQEIEKELPDLFAKWFDKSDDLRIVIDSFANTILNEGAYEESIFLNIVQTLEHFYGLIFPTKSRLFEKTKWECFIEKLKITVPKYLAEASIVKSLEESSIPDQIINRIASLNIATFRSRLETLLFEMSQPPLMPLLDNPDDPDKAIKELLKKLEDTRNYLIHYNKDLAAKAFFDDDLRKACSTCWALLNYWIGKQIGLSDRIAGEIARKASRAMFFVSQKSKL
jgi:hypothetical protein